MNISYIKKTGKNKLQITLEDSEEFIVSEREWQRIMPEGSDWIEDEILSELYENYFLPKAKYKALNLLKSRDHTREELIRKLKMAGFPNLVIKKTLEYVDSYHYLDDHRYAENYIAYRGKYKSRKALLYELSQKGIDKEIVCETEAFQENCDDRASVLAIILKRWGEHPTPEVKEKDRMTRYLARHGFSANDIFSVYRDLDI